ncbi:MarR family winged helix-turn-helix transcriptional regulator [Celeribacter neptunius]|uniref:DNA-binding transcriptional regulator, MarR family n=1 Tax=Celeribacter neptunius TaxID=588602 RepID=A0A1I3LV24_9RHOB|nr:MarR family transcriptional regulator [Celeribacter neptunius]SFI88523.1 DNA-binding transcriptional regulator, MarR family [Celeribacter neptunius]
MDAQNSTDQGLSLDEIRAQWASERPDLDTAPMGLIGRMGRVARLLSREMDATFARHGLNAASFDLLATLRRAGPPHALTAGELMARMMITSGTVTNRINRLETQGLVARRSDKEDARRAIVGLTETGFALIDRAVEDHVATQKRLTELLSGEEFAQLDGLLESWLGRLSEAGKDG